VIVDKDKKYMSFIIEKKRQKILDALKKVIKKRVAKEDIVTMTGQEADLIKINPANELKNRTKSEQVNHNNVEVNERKMSKAEIRKRERIVLGLKDKLDDFKDRYGKERGKKVMYATATKMAMKEDDKTMTGQEADSIKMNPSAPTKEGIGIKSTTT